MRRCDAATVRRMREERKRVGELVKHGLFLKISYVCFCKKTKLSYICSYVSQID